MTNLTAETMVNQFPNFSVTRALYKSCVERIDVSLSHRSMKMCRSNIRYISSIAPLYIGKSMFGNRIRRTCTLSAVKYTFSDVPSIN